MATVQLQLCCGAVCKASDRQTYTNVFIPKLTGIPVMYTAVVVDDDDDDVLL